MPVFYKGKQIGERRVDFLVEGKICVELKALVNWKMFIWLKGRTIWKHLTLK